MEHAQGKNMHIVGQHGEVYVSKSLKLIDNERHTIAVSTGNLLVISDIGDVETHEIPYGAILHAQHGQRVKPGSQLTSICPTTTPIVAEVRGEVVLLDCVEGVSVARAVDEVTNMTCLQVIKTRKSASSKVLAPRIFIRTEGKFGACTDVLPVGTQIFVTHNNVMRGDILARVPSAK